MKELLYDIGMFDKDSSFLSSSTSLYSWFVRFL